MSCYHAETNISSPTPCSHCKFISGISRFPAHKVRHGIEKLMHHLADRSRGISKAMTAEGVPNASRSPILFGHNRLGDPENANYQIDNSSCKPHIQYTKTFLPLLGRSRYDAGPLDNLRSGSSGKWPETASLKPTNGLGASVPCFFRSV